MSVPTYYKVRSLFLKGLAVIYALAFGSLATQIVGLLGHRGILPVDILMPQVHHILGKQFYRFPTLAWFWTSDSFLRGVCYAGVGLAALAFFELLPTLNFFLLWFLYLSLVTIGGDFLSFQWDSLLLEAGFLGFLWAPVQLRPRKGHEDPPSLWGVWLLRCLLFRLLFESGAVKLLSGDPTWRHWTALRVYYETMPIPNPVSWAMHQLPAWFQTVSVGFTFFVELFLPFLIFAPRAWRRFAFAGMVTFQILIFATGNYAFFNLLTILLCVPLLEDRDLDRNASQAPEATILPLWRARLRGAFCAFIFLAGVLNFLSIGGVHTPFNSILETLAPFRSVNNYGLFAVMTTTRPEIIVEGSEDGKNWLAYEFKYKPQLLDRRPPFVAPHQPRLDWQMWFAALGSYQNSPWFMNFGERLLEGSPEVLALLRKNPFPHHPPRYLRAMLYRYQFTTPAERRQAGLWWKRELQGPYCPVLSLEQNRPIL
jgi:lipase maturation factor 1